MKKYKRPDYVFKNSQTKWGLEGGGVRLVLHRTVFVKATLFFSFYFLTVLLLNVLRFFITIE